jgi:hypothetical protein
MISNASLIPPRTDFIANAPLRPAVGQLAVKDMLKQNAWKKLSLSTDCWAVETGVGCEQPVTSVQEIITINRDNLVTVSIYNFSQMSNQYLGLKGKVFIWSMMSP